MAAGDNTASSIIWVAGEATGKNIYGASHALPLDIETGIAAATAVAAAAAASALAGEIITVSGGVPTAAPGGLPFQFNTNTRKLSAWTGSAWVTVSGA